MTYDPNSVEIQFSELTRDTIQFARVAVGRFFISKSNPGRIFASDQATRDNGNSRDALSAEKKFASSFIRTFFTEMTTISFKFTSILILNSSNEIIH